MTEHFTTNDYTQMTEARGQIHDVLQPIANKIEAAVPSFEGFALFQQDAYHPDSAGAIVQINASRVDDSRLSFQETHVTNRRVDLSVSTLGQVFEHGQYQLEESRMNPNEHLVAGLHLAEKAGKRAASVFQLAFTKELGSPSSDELAMIRQYWLSVAPECELPLQALHAHAALFPNHSVSDALRLDVPTTPNAFVVNWDTSHSREQAVADYGKLRYDLTLRGAKFLNIVERHSGKLMRPTGDGQSFALEIPAGQYDRLSDDSIAQFASTTLIPMVQALAQEAKTDGASPIRIAVDLGRIEHTTFDLSSPALFALAETSDRQPHDKVSVDFGQRAVKALQLTAADIQAFNA